MSICVLCNNQFEPLKKQAHTRKYCYDCVPFSPNRYEVTSNIRRAMKKQAIINMGNKCSICGYDKCQSALEFHHLDIDEKSFTIGSGQNRPWEDYWSEVQKCILVCANCHREIHSTKKP